LIFFDAIRIKVRDEGTGVHQGLLRHSAAVERTAKGGQPNVLTALGIRDVDVTSSPVTRRLPIENNGPVTSAITQRKSPLAKMLGDFDTHSQR
jgi:hypothetical protein